MRESAVDVLVPTYRRPVALVVTLTSLSAQTFPAFRVVVSDQTEDFDVADSLEAQAVVRLLESGGREVELRKNLPRRGMAQQRQFLLDRARAPYVLFVDDDVILEPGLLERMVATIEEERCAFVGSALIGLSFLDDVRPAQQAIEFWDGPVRPEEVRPGTRAWERYRLHSAANIYHLQRRLGLTDESQRTYRVAWVGGCVLYDAEKLREVDAFSFWPQLPSLHSGEDVVVQLRLMERYGGCGIIPSGAYHQELPTTVVDPPVNVPLVLR